MRTRYQLDNSMLAILVFALLAECVRSRDQLELSAHPVEYLRISANHYRRRVVSGSGRQTSGTIRLLSYSRR